MMSNSFLSVYKRLIRCRSFRSDFKITFPFDANLLPLNITYCKNSIVLIYSWLYCRVCCVFLPLPETAQVLKTYEV